MKETNKINKRRQLAKFEIVKESILKDILKGVYQPGEKLPPDKVLHEKYNVSPVTAVKAVEALSREGIVTRVGGRGTFVSEQKRPPLINGRVLKIGLIWIGDVSKRKMESSYGMVLLKGILSRWEVNEEPEYIERSPDLATKAIYNQTERSFSLHVLGEAQSSNERHPPLKDIKKENFDGLILLGVSEDKWIEKLLKLKIPTVLADYPSEIFQNKSDRVWVDTRFGYKSATQYFLNKGNKKIHFIGTEHWPAAPSAEMSPNEWSQYKIGKERLLPETHWRLASIRQAMDENDMVLPDDQIHFIQQDEKDAVALAKKLMELPKSKRPEVILCSNYFQANTIIKEFKKNKLKLEGAGASHEKTKGPAKLIFANINEIGFLSADMLLLRLKNKDMTNRSLSIGTSFIN